MSYVYLFGFIGFFLIIGIVRFYNATLKENSHSQRDRAIRHAELKRMQADDRRQKQRVWDERMRRLGTPTKETNTQNDGKVIVYAHSQVIVLKGEEFLFSKIYKCTMESAIKEGRKNLVRQQLPYTRKETWKKVRFQHVERRYIQRVIKDPDRILYKVTVYISDLKYPTMVFTFVDPTKAKELKSIIDMIIRTNNAGHLYPIL